MKISTISIGNNQILAAQRRENNNKNQKEGELWRLRVELQRLINLEQEKENSLECYNIRQVYSSDRLDPFRQYSDNIWYAGLKIHDSISLGFMFVRQNN